MNPKFLFTSAIIPKFEEIRQEEYLKSYNQLLSFGIKKEDIYVIETVKTESCFWEDVTDNLFYTNTHLSYLRNKGVLEANAILKFFRFYTFEPQQPLIKLTGRYLLQSPNFIEATKNTHIVYTTDSHGQAFFGCIGMRYNLMKTFFEALDLNLMEQRMINIELMARMFIDQVHGLPDNINLALHLPKIDVMANVNNQKVLYW